MYELFPKSNDFFAKGVHPAVSSATSACMILFTSLTASISFALAGLLKTDYSVMCLLLGFLSTMVGQIVMASLVRRYKRHSYIVFSVGIVVALSAFCMTTESIIAISRS